MVTTSATTEVLPDGLGPKPVSNLKRRQRAHYYRRITVQGGEMVWVRTELLPSDLNGRDYYTTKGFRLTPPEGTEWALSNTAEREAAAKAKAEGIAKIEADARAKVEAENKGIMETLLAEIASLKAQAQAKGIEETQRKAGRPRKQGG